MPLVYFTGTGLSPRTYFLVFGLFGFLILGGEKQVNYLPMIVGAEGVCFTFAYEVQMTYDTTLKSRRHRNK